MPNYVIALVVIGNLLCNLIIYWLGKIQGRREAERRAMAAIEQLSTAMQNEITRLLQVTLLTGALRSIVGVWDRYEDQRPLEKEMETARTALKAVEYDA